MREKKVEFHYIHAKENPADLSSRGLSSNGLKWNSLWWKGPVQLKHGQISLPTWNMPKINETTLKTMQSEVRGSKIRQEASVTPQEQQVFPKTVSQAVKTDITPPFEIKTKNYASLNKILRITAYTNRFIKKLKKINTLRGVPTANKTEMANITG